MANNKVDWTVIPGNDAPEDNHRAGLKFFMAVMVLCAGALFFGGVRL